MIYYVRILFNLDQPFLYHNSTYSTRQFTFYTILARMNAVVFRHLIFNFRLYPSRDNA